MATVVDGGSPPVTLQKLKKKIIKQISKPEWKKKGKRKKIGLP